MGLGSALRRTGAVTLGTVRGIPIRSRRDSNQRVNRSTVPGERASFIERGLRADAGRGATGFLACRVKAVIRRRAHPGAL